MIAKLREILTTFTDESQKAIVDKCLELGFDTNRGIVSLDESFINLRTIRQILIDAIDNRKLIQLPISVQKTLLGRCDALSRSMTNLLNGSDEVENVVNSIEAVNLDIWQYGLHNLSEEVLGYLEKMNQLKNEEIEISKAKRELGLALKNKRSLEKLLQSASEKVETLGAQVAKLAETTQKASELLSTTAKVSQEAAALLANIQQNDSTATQLLAKTKTSHAEVSALEPKVKEFYAQIDQYKAKINTTSAQALEVVATNSEKTDALISQLDVLESQIKDSILKATGHSLFHSFQTRQFELAKSKTFWIWSILALVLTSLGVSVFVLLTTTTFDVVFYVKLSMALPLTYAIAFCTVQYGRERKLEEEYAFKSNISISLIPYKELVEKLVDEKQAGEREKFTAFIIDAITRVYSSPTAEIFDGERKTSSSRPNSTQQLKEAAESVAKVMEPLVRALKH